jgi:hypothetical protein
LFFETFLSWMRYAGGVRPVSERLRLATTCHATRRRFRPPALTVIGYSFRHFCFVIFPRFLLLQCSFVVVSLRRVRTYTQNKKKNPCQTPFEQLPSVSRQSVNNYKACHSYNWGWGWNSSVSAQIYISRNIAIFPRVRTTSNFFQYISQCTVHRCRTRIFFLFKFFLMSKKKPQKTKNRTVKPC